MHSNTEKWLALERRANWFKMSRSHWILRFEQYLNFFISSQNNEITIYSIRTNSVLATNSRVQTTRWVERQRAYIQCTYIVKRLTGFIVNIKHTHRHSALCSCLHHKSAPIIFFSTWTALCYCENEPAEPLFRLHRNR